MNTVWQPNEVWRDLFFTFWRRMTSIQIARDAIDFTFTKAIVKKTGCVAPRL